MKHITTLIALALTLGTLVPLAAQTQMTAKEKRTQTRQERKIAQQKAREQLYQDAVRKQHFRAGSRSIDFQTGQVGKCQFCQEFYFHGKQKSHRTSQF